MKNKVYLIIILNHFIECVRGFSLGVISEKYRVYSFLNVYVLKPWSEQVPFGKTVAKVFMVCRI